MPPDLPHPPLEGQRSQEPREFRPRPLDDKQACAFALSMVTRQTRAVSATVSPDGSNITINGSVGGRSTGPELKLRESSSVKVYTREGLTTLDGQRCSFDRTQKLGVAAALLLRLALEEPMHLRPPSTEKGPQGQTSRRGSLSDPKKFAVAACAKVYPEVEALRAEKEIGLEGMPTMRFHRPQFQPLGASVTQ